VKPTDCAALLSALVRRLEDAYAVCVTAETALAAQNADHDAEIARCLRAGVSEVVAAELQRLRKAIARLETALRYSDRDVRGKDNGNMSSHRGPGHRFGVIAYLGGDRSVPDINE